MALPPQSLLRLNDSRITEALINRTELADVDFKASFDPTSTREWVEIVKDLVAMANSGGGAILVGIADDGTSSGSDLGAVNELDPATVADKLRSYTGSQFPDLQIRSLAVDGLTLTALGVGAVDLPVVFVKPGTYPVDKNQQKTAFGVGTVYFRHGPKSEPADSHDLRNAFDRHLARTRSGWLENIRKVVEAPSDARVSVVASGTASGVRLTHDPAASPLGVPSVDDTHPYRQKELVKAVNEKLAGRATINAHDILCLRRAHEVHKNFTYCYNLNYTSPQYSRAFVDWIVQQYDADPRFFDEARRRHSELKVASKAPKGNAS